MSYLMNNNIFQSSSFANVNLSNKVSGYTTPAEYDLIVQRYGFTDSGGDHASDRTAWSLSGYNGDNTTAIDNDDGTPVKQRIYFKATGTTDYVIQGYTDAAMSTGLVISGTESTRTTGSTVTLTAENTSGLSGTVTIGDAATNDTWYIDIEYYYTKYDGDVDSSSANIVGFLVSEDDPDSDEDLWKVADAGVIVDLDNLLVAEGVSNVDNVFARNTLINQLVARGWKV